MEEARLHNAHVQSHEKYLFEIATTKEDSIK
jgi:hypothetical protein